MSEETKESPLLDVAKVNQLIRDICQVAQLSNCNLLEMRQACNSILTASEEQIKVTLAELRTQRSDCPRLADELAPNIREEGLWISKTPAK